MFDYIIYQFRSIIIFHSWDGMKYIFHRAGPKPLYCVIELRVDRAKIPRLKIAEYQWLTIERGQMHHMGYVGKLLHR